MDLFKIDESRITNMEKIWKVRYTRIDPYLTVLK